MKTHNKLGILTIIGVISSLTWVPPTLAWADQQVHGPDRQAVAYIIRQSDHIAGLQESQGELIKAIKKLERSLKDAESEAVKGVIKDLERQREYNRKRLDNASELKEKVLVLFEGRKTVTMR